MSQTVEFSPQLTADLPRLLPVPPQHHDLTIKATHSGIVILKEGRFKKRYTGSRTAEVDINGKLYLKRSDYKKAIFVPDKKGHKKRASAMNAPELSNPLEVANNNITENSESSPPREYHVNKVEVKNRIHGMINTRKGKRELYFWTVTFPAGISDTLAYQAFNTWLTALRQKKFLRNYLWVAERQKNGTVHFHLTIPHKMSVVLANRYMRTTLTTYSKKGLINYSVFQAKRYNGVDIAKNRKTGRVTNFAIKKGTRALSFYLTKYVTKNDAGFPHLAWHNSRGFSALFTGITFTVQEFLKVGFDRLLFRKSVLNNQFFMFFPWAKDPPDLIIDHLHDLNSYIGDSVAA